MRRGRYLLVKKKLSYSYYGQGMGSKAEQFEGSLWKSIAGIKKTQAKQKTSPPYFHE